MTCIKTDEISVFLTLLTSTKSTKKEAWKPYENHMNWWSETDMNSSKVVASINLMKLFFPSAYWISLLKWEHNLTSPNLHWNHITQMAEDLSLLCPPQGLGTAPWNCSLLTFLEELKYDKPLSWWLHYFFSIY